MRRQRPSLTLAAKIALLRKASAGLRHESELALGSEALFAANLIDNWMSARVVALRGVAELRSVRTVLDTAVALAREDVDATNQALADVAAVAPEIESIEVIDLRGAIIASTTDEAQPEPLRSRPEVQAALGGSDYISGVSISPTSGAACIYTAAPARGSNGTVVGVVRARESVDRFQALVAGARARIGSGARGVLIDASGTIVAGTAYVTVAEPLRRAGWTYAAALPVAEIEGEANAFLRGAIAFAALGLVAASLLSALVAQRVVGAIRRLIAVTRDVVARNDLTRPSEITSDDEVGQLAQSFSQMVAALRGALTTLQSSSASLLEAAEQLRQTTESERELLGRQATALQQTQTTAHEIRQTSSLAAEKANIVVRAAEGADVLGHSGEEAVQDSIAGLSTIQARVGEVGERIRAVGDSARQIGSITGTVKDLADQSNMLALNAAIEAVRSGEHGKGFAVVAREIRSLADQSIAATRRVSEILEALGASIQSAVTISDQGDRAVGDGLVRVQASGENMRACSESRSRTPKRRARSPPRSASRTRESSRSSSPSPISWR